MYMFDKQCKHIVFGCEDGEIYAPILKRFTEKIETTQRVTLLHGTEPDRHLAALHIDKTQMNDIFRNTIFTNWSTTLQNWILSQHSLWNQ